MIQRNKKLIQNKDDIERLVLIHKILKSKGFSPDMYYLIERYLEPDPEMFTSLSFWFNTDNVRLAIPYVWVPDKKIELKIATVDDLL